MSDTASFLEKLIDSFASRNSEKSKITIGIRKTNKLKNEVSLDESLNSDSDGNELLLEDVLYAENESVSKDMEKSAEKEILWQILEKLNAREKEIMILRFGLSGNEEKTQKEVADMLGISQSYISRIEKKVINQQGEDKTYAFYKGAELSLALAKKYNVKKAILKAKSPSCGKGKIYDGTFSGTLVDGNGVCALESNVHRKQLIEIILENDTATNNINTKYIDNKI